MVYRGSHDDTAARGLQFLAKSAGRDRDPDRDRHGQRTGAADDDANADRQPGVVTLRYAVRGFSVTVKARYDSNNVTIKYSDSTELGYGTEDGVAVIHPNYNRWVNNLAHDIAAELSISSIR